MNGGKTSRTDGTAESGYCCSKQNDKALEKDAQALQSGRRPMGDEVPQFERVPPKTSYQSSVSGNDTGAVESTDDTEPGEASADGGSEESGEDSTGTDGELESGQDGTGDAGGTEPEAGGVQSDAGGTERESVSGDTASEESDSVDEELLQPSGESGTGAEGESGTDAGGDTGTVEERSGESGEPVEEESEPEYITTYSTEENNYSTIVSENYSDILIVFLLAALIGIIAAGILWRK